MAAYTQRLDGVYLGLLIMIINQQILGDRYRALTAKLFGDMPAPLTLMGGFDQKAVDQFDVSQIKDLVVEELC